MDDTFDMATLLVNDPGLRMGIQNLLQAELHKLIGQVPVEYRKKCTKELVGMLVDALMDGTVFEIVKRLQENQSMTERELFRQRSELVQELKTREADLSKRQCEELLRVGTSKGSQLQCKHQKELKELKAISQDRLRRKDLAIVEELDSLAEQQQETLAKAGLPGFFVTKSPIEIRLQMHLMEFMLKLQRPYEAMLADTLRSDLLRCFLSLQSTPGDALKAKRLRMAFIDLPVAELLRIFKLLPAADVVALCFTCHRFADIVSEHYGLSFSFTTRTVLVKSSQALSLRLGSGWPTACLNVVSRWACRVIVRDTGFEVCDLPRIFQPACGASVSTLRLYDVSVIASASLEDLKWPNIWNAMPNLTELVLHNLTVVDSDGLPPPNHLPSPFSAVSSKALLRLQLSGDGMDLNRHDYTTIHLLSTLNAILLTDGIEVLSLTDIFPEILFPEVTLFGCLKQHLHLTELYVGPVSQADRLSSTTQLFCAIVNLATHQLPVLKCLVLDAVVVDWQSLCELVTHARTLRVLMLRGELSLLDPVSGPLPLPERPIALSSLRSFIGGPFATRITLPFNSGAHVVQSFAHAHVSTFLASSGAAQISAYKFWILRMIQELQ